jgi:Ca2+-binding RTX toxin-like protein
MGLAGSDVLAGAQGDDVLDGGAGNDALYGGLNTSGSWAGNDTYVFGRGYSQDTVSDYDISAGNVDTIRLKDLNAGDVTIRRDATTLYVSVNGSDDQLRVPTGVTPPTASSGFSSTAHPETRAADVATWRTEGADTLTGTSDSRP